MRTVAIQITKDLAALAACHIIQNSFELLKIYCFSIPDIEAVPVDSHVPTITGNIQLAAGRADSAAAAYDLAALRQRIAPVGKSSILLLKTVTMIFLYKSIFLFFISAPHPFPIGFTTFCTPGTTAVRFYRFLH